MPLLTTARKLAVGRLLGRTLRTARGIAGRRSDWVVAHRHGVALELDLREGIDLAVYLGVYERRTFAALARECRPGAVVLDIGANIGVHALPLARLVGPAGRVIAFEPSDYGQTRLGRQLALNPELRSRLTVLPVFLAAHDAGPAPDRVYARWTLDGAPGAARHERYGGIAEAASGARARSLDAVIDELGLSHVDLVKMDTDGFELQILAGARGLLGRLRPRFVAELCPHMLEERAASGSALLEAFLAANYRLLELDGRTPLGDEPDAIVARIPHGASRDFCAFPR